MSKRIDLNRTEKQCSRCRKIKPLTEFGQCKGRRDRLHWRCRPCASAHNLDYIANNKERMAAVSRKWRKEHPGYQTCHGVGLPVGAGLKLYNLMKERQNGMCAICLRLDGDNIKLGFDHDHKTGKIRGLLCNPCNFLIGRGQDNPNLFLAAANYLKRVS